jgi:C4-dicarboxylate-binding protein DctP
MTIKLSHVAAKDTPKGQASEKFKQVVEEKSDGNIKVKVYPNGQLYGDEDEIQALQANNVQIIIPSTAKLSGFDKTFLLFDLPFLFKDNKHLYQFEDGKAGQKLLDKLDNHGMKGLAFWPNGFKDITNSKRPIKEPKDLKGLKIRTHGGQILNDFYDQLGAASTKLAFNDVYQALQLGTVDGEENSLANIYTQSYGEVQKYLTITNHGRSEYTVVANKQWWEGLDQKTQDLINQAMKAATKVGRDKAEALANKELKRIKEKGNMKVYKLTPDQHQEFVDAVKPVIDKWTEKLDPDIINAIKKMQ